MFNNFSQDFLTLTVNVLRSLVCDPLGQQKLCVNVLRLVLVGILIQQQKDKLTVVWAVVIPVARIKKVLTNSYSNIGPLEGWKMRF